MPGAARLITRPIASYPGSKNGAGVWQRVLSQMPPHVVYVEAFLGSGALLYAKRPAEYSLAIDRDIELLKLHRPIPPATAMIAGDALQLLPSLKLSSRDLVYADPPYHPSSRVKKQIYLHETDAAWHTRFLAMLQALPCMTMVSGYRCEAYDQALATWRRVDYRAQTRGGPRIESLWCNFEEPKKLHDPRFAGDGFRERERIKRKRQRWTARLKAMSAAERQIVLEALIAADGETGQRLAPAPLADAGEERSPSPLAAAGEVGPRGTPAAARAPVNRRSRSAA